jgi:ankyrin repeat protein
VPLLNFAILHNSIESFKLLLAAGAPFGTFADISLLGAVAGATQSMDLAKLLLEAKADVNEGLDISSALGCAIIVDNADMVKLFIDAGADLHKRTVEGMTCLHLACDSSQDNVVNAVTAWGADPDDKRLAGIQCGRFLTGRVVETLIDGKADVSAKDPRGITPAMLAATHNYHPMLQVLLNRGANVNDVDQNGLSVLHYAVINKSLRAAEFLIAAGADFNNKFGDAGLTPLGTAVWVNDPQMVKLLVDAKADLNILCVNGVPALTLAQRKGFSEVVAVLEDAGAASWDTVLGQESDFLLMASIGEASETAKLIHTTSDLEKEVALVLACRALVPSLGHRQVVQQLLAVGTDPSCCISEYVPLIEASAHGALEVVQELVKARADVKAKSHCGQTALQAAAKMKHRDVVSYLLANTHKK